MANYGSNYSPNGQRPQDDLDKIIEQGIRETVNAVSQLVQEVSGTVRANASSGFWQEAWQEVQNAVREETKKQKPHVAAYRVNKDKTKPQKQSTGKKLRSRAGSMAWTAFGLSFPAVALTGAWYNVAFVEGEMPGAIIVGGLALCFALPVVYHLARAFILRRAAFYCDTLAERTNCNISELAQAMDKPVFLVRRDVRRMIRTGALVGYRVSPNGQKLFASDIAYRLYVGESAKEQAVKQEQAFVVPVQEKPADAPHTVADECIAFNAELRRRKQSIDDAAVAEQVAKLEKHVDLIVAWLQKHPGKEDRVRRFTAYYLPTVLKLLETYHDVDAHAAGGASVAANIQTDIAGILHTVEGAFVALENGLMQDTALNVMAEISAMETMLAQDGLAQSDFSPT